MVNKEIDPEDLKIVIKSEESIPFVQILQNINIIQQVLFCGKIQRAKVMLQFQNYHYKDCGLINDVYKRVYEDIGNIFIRRLRNFIMELPSFIDKDQRIIEYDTSEENKSDEEASSAFVIAVK